MSNENNAVQLEEVDCDTANYYDNANTSTNYNFPKCDPVNSPDNEKDMYVEREQLDED